MGRRGPAPAPTKLKLLRGDKPSRINHKEPIASDALPVCPDWAEDEVRDVWDYALAELIRMGTASSADRDLLLAYCHAVVNHAKACRMLAKSTVLIQGMHGNPVRNPALAVQRDNAELMRRLSQAFGFSPSDRTRIEVDRAATPVDEPGNPFAAHG